MQPRYMIIPTLIAILATHAAAGEWALDYYITGPDYTVNATVEVPDGYVAGGHFSHVPGVNESYLAYYDGLNWVGLQAHLNGAVRDMIFDPEHLYVCGEFTMLGGTPAQHVAVYTELGWAPMGAGVPNAGSNLAYYGGDVFCDGYRWNGSSWEDVFAYYGTVNSLFVFDGQLLAGGTFYVSGELDLTYLLAWDGAHISDPYVGLTGPPTALAEYEGSLLAQVGDYDPELTTPYPLAAWTGTHWEEVGNFPVTDTYYQQTDLLVIGQEMFVSAIDGYFSTVMYWDGQGWTEIMRSLLGNVKDLSIYMGDVLISGGFKAGENLPTRNIALWQSSSGIGPAYVNDGLGADGLVFDLSVGQAGLLAGGDFRQLGGVATASVAFQNGGGWQDTYSAPQLTAAEAVGWHSGRAVCSGYHMSDIMDIMFLYDDGGMWRQPVPYVGDMYLYDKLLSIGGDLIGSSIYSGLSGILPEISFSDLGAVSGAVKDITIFQDILIAVGDFTAIDGVPASGVAAFDGMNWSAVFPDLSGVACAAMEWNDQLLLLGDFVLPGGGSHLGVVLCYETVIMPLGPAMSSLDISCEADIVIYHDRPIVSGKLGAVDGVIDVKLVEFDGMDWIPVEGGVDGNIFDMAVYDDRLWIAGDFKNAGGVPASNLTWWYEETLAIDSRDPESDPQDLPANFQVSAPYPNPFNPSTSLSFALPAAGQVNCAVYDLRGHRIITLLDGWLGAGHHDLTWTGLDDKGRAVTSGTYLLRIVTPMGVHSEKAVLIR
jgi:hypothetical protein